MKLLASDTFTTVYPVLSSGYDLIVANDFERVNVASLFPPTMVSSSPGENSCNASWLFVPSPS